MKTLTHEQARELGNELRKMGLAVGTTADGVVILETPEELAAHSQKQPPPEPDPVMDADERVFRRRLLRVMAQRFGVTASELKDALSRDA